MMRQVSVLAWLACAATLLLAGCPRPEPAEGDAAQPAGTSAGAAAGSGTAQPGAVADGSDEAAQPPAGLFPPTGPPKQIIIMYTGDTLSQATPRRAATSTEGGLSALAHAVSDYQASIVDYNRRRVEDEGGDPTKIRADLSAGMLGEHPYLLLDYGGWERPIDYAGQVYVALYFRYFTDFHYSAVAGRAYTTLSSERWQAYRDLDFAPTLLVTGAERTAGALDSVPVVTREVHGQRWGIAALPLPGELQSEVIAQYAELLAAAQAELTAAGSELSILLLSLAPTAIYRAQAEDSTFTVIIGADPRTGVKPGYGDMPAQGALLLPTVDPSGRQAAACHLYFEPGGDRPVMYFFTFIDCHEDETQPWPYRRLVSEASQRHYELVQEHRAAQQ